jgi:hypothetical protein
MNPSRIRGPAGSSSGTGLQAFLQLSDYLREAGCAECATTGVGELPDHGGTKEFS